MTEQAIAQAAQLLQRGALREARTALHEIVRREPGNVDALNLLGIALAQAKEFAAAADALRRATLAAPQHAGAQLNYGRVLRQLGQLTDAAASFERAVALRPEAPLGALKQLGGVLIELKRHEEAVACYARVLALEPNDAVALNDRGVALLALQRAEEALADFDAALATDAGVGARTEKDGLAATLALRGEALRALGRAEEAVESFEQAIARDARHWGAWAGLGTVQLERERFDAAIAAFNQALTVRPGEASAHLGRARAAKGLGNLPAAAFDLDRVLTIEPGNAVALSFRVGVRRELGRREEALSDCDRALALTGDDLSLHNARGVLLDELGRTAEALACFEKALKIDPRNWIVLQNLGAALVRLKRGDEAIATCDASLRDAPHNADLWLTKGAVLYALHRFNEAVAAFDRAIVEQPDLTGVHFHRALALLTEGRLPEGFAAYEWRRRGDEPFVKVPKFDLPEPSSLDDVKGKRLMLYREQGLGDIIQFARYARVFADQGVKVSVLTYPALARLLASLGEGIEIVSDGAVPSVDYAFPLMSAPLLAATTLQTVPAQVPYLRADDALVETWRARLAPGRGLRVGIAWSGNPQHQADWARSIPFEKTRRVLGVEGVTYFSVQKDVRAADEAALADSGVIDHRALLTDFSETAAMMAALDLVITVDTSVAHLAGALGVPVWIMLATRVDWRWLTAGDKSAWYPTARLFRQREHGEWDDVLDEVRDALSALRQKRGDV